MTKTAHELATALQVETNLRLNAFDAEPLRHDHYQRLIAEDAKIVLLAQLEVFGQLLDHIEPFYKLQKAGSLHSMYANELRSVIAATKANEPAEVIVDAANELAQKILRAPLTVLFMEERKAKKENLGNADLMLAAYTDYTYLLKTDGKLMVLTDEPTKAKHFKNHTYKNLYSLLPHNQAQIEAANLPFTQPNAKGELVPANICKAWTESAARKDLSGITFDPSTTDRVVHGHYNTWRGWRDWGEPVEGADLPFWELTLDVICDGNTEYFEFVQKWIAHLVQFPQRRPLCALGIKGGQGKGKSSFVKVIGGLMHEAHYNKNVSMEAISGRQQGRDLEGVLLAYVDEATWGGDLSAVGSLKKAITGESDRINEKFVPAYDIPTYKRLIFTSNEDYYYHADSDDRRLLPLEIDDSKPTKPDSFFQQLFDGEAYRPSVQAALMKTLRGIDLTGWIPHVALKSLKITTGSALQERSMPAVMRWLKHCLENREFVWEELFEGSMTPMSVNEDCIPVASLQKSYADYSKHASLDRSRQVNLNDVEARNQLYKVFGHKATQIKRHGKNQRAYRIDWVAMRRNFENCFKWKVQWESDDDFHPVETKVNVVSIHEAKPLRNLKTVSSALLKSSD